VAAFELPVPWPLARTEETTRCVLVNGRPWKGTFDGTLSGLLRALGIDCGTHAVAVGGVLVSRHEVDRRAIQPGEDVEIVENQGGG
jgi:sulfur carrier protein ThiS